MTLNQNIEVEKKIAMEKNAARKILCNRRNFDYIKFLLMFRFREHHFKNLQIKPQNEKIQITLRK